MSIDFIIGGDSVKRTTIVLGFSALISSAFAQEAAQGNVASAQPAPAAPTGLAASLNQKVGVYVFPAKNQDAATQEKDANDCYTWGRQQSGVDPLNMAPVQAEATAKGPDGSAVKGAAKGAAAGAAIGAIAGDAGKGAAIGAAGGGMKGAAGRRKGQAQQQQQAQKAAEQKTAGMLDSFKKAYSACLTGKGYTVN